MEVACEVGGRHEFGRGQAGEIGGAVQQAVQATELGLQPLRQCGVVVRRGAGLAARLVAAATVNNRLTR